jgi:proteic killer suppression protein
MGSVITSFRDKGTEDIFDGADTRAARKACPRSIWSVARRKLDQINRVRDVQELAVPPGNRLERLRGDRAGQHSIRINDQFRICFRWETGEAHEVEVTDYH